MMSFRILLLLGLAVSPLTAQSRIAGVEVSRAFREFHATKISMEEFDKERQAIADEPRASDLEQLKQEVVEAKRALTTAAGSDEATRREAQRVVGLKIDELRSMENALRESRNSRTTDLNRRLVGTTRKLLDQVRAAAAEAGKKRGYDIVVDTSGNTNTGLSVILYARKLPDLTNDVIAQLNKDAPPPAAAVVAEGSAAEPDPPAAETTPEAPAAAKAN